MDAEPCLLPGGYVDATGRVHREVELAPLSGREEELLAEGSGRSHAALVTQIVSRCIRRIGTISPVSTSVARGLLVADRQYLMLKLREATLGDLVQATIGCPWPECGRPIDIDFLLSAVPVIPGAAPGPTYPLTLSAEAALVAADGRAHRELRLRLPTGADQEAALAQGDEERALGELLRRCVVAVGEQASPDPALIARLGPLARAEIEQALEAVAPRVELMLAGTCPECGRPFSRPFDLAAFFFGELRLGREQLYREVHYLAYHYHWSEREIMGLSRQKRRLYITILGEAIERLNDGAT